MVVSQNILGDMGVKVATESTADFNIQVSIQIPA